METCVGPSAVGGRVDLVEVLAGRGAVAKLDEGFDEAGAVQDRFAAVVGRVAVNGFGQQVDSGLGLWS